MSCVQEFRHAPATLDLHPAIPPHVEEVRRALRVWSADPVPLPRPVLLHPGWMSPPWVLNPFLRTLKSCASRTQGRIVQAACHPFIPIRDLGRRLAARMEALCEEGDGIDVIGHSMGGIVTREAARQRGGPRLRVARLFCIASPHAGAGLIAKLTPHHHAQALRVGSAYLDELNADPTSHDFEIHTFRLQKDLVISAESAHAVGGKHYDWPSSRRWITSHAQSQWDVRFCAAVVGLLLGRIPG